MNKYNQLREEIIKANEDILELKMGCVIMFAEKGILFRAAIYQQNYAGNYLIETIGEATTTIKRNQIKEIIGRDITLEDVLVALYNIEFETDMCINFYKWKIQYWDEKFDIVIDSCDWVPNKPLQDQSEETKDFLFDLIVKK